MKRPLADTPHMRYQVDVPSLSPQKGQIATKLVDQEASDHCCIVFVDNCLGADELRDHHAPIDISRHNHRHIGFMDKAHIGNVRPAQVDLRRTARALDDHQIMSRFQVVKAFEHFPRIFGFRV